MIMTLLFFFFSCRHFYFLLRLDPYSICIMFNAVITDPGNVVVVSRLFRKADSPSAMFFAKITGNRWKRFQAPHEWINDCIVV